MKIENRRAALWTIGAYAVSCTVILLGYAHTGDRGLTTFAIVGSAIGLVFSLLRIPAQAERNARFVERRRARGPRGFWRGTLHEASSLFGKLLIAGLIAAVVLYLKDGTNLVGWLLDQSLGTIGLLVFVIAISMFLTGAAFHASDKQRYEELTGGEEQS